MGFVSAGPMYELCRGLLLVLGIVRRVVKECGWLLMESDWVGYELLR